jgi:DNA-binding MarR family transcriptional regulator
MGKDQRSLDAPSAGVSKSRGDAAKARSSKLSALRECACLNLRWASRAVSQVYDEALRPAGLKTTQFSLLGAVWKYEGASIQELADGIGLDRTSLTRALQPLERDGLLAIATSATDGRVRSVSLTDEGRRRLEAGYPLWKQAQAELERRVGGERLQELVASLRELVHLVQS